MNESTPNETSISESADPAFYSLEETAARWTKLRGENTTTQTLLAYGVLDDNELVFSVFVSDWYLFKKFTDDHSGEITITRVPLRGLVSLRKQTIEELLTKGAVEVDWVRGCTDAPEGNTFRGCAVSTHHWGAGQESWKPVFDEYQKNFGRTFPRITEEDLVISKTERDRMEKEFPSPSLEVKTGNHNKDLGISQEGGGKETVDAPQDLGTGECDRFEDECGVETPNSDMADEIKLQPTNYTTPYMEIMKETIATYFEPRRDIDAKREEVVEWVNKRLIEVGIGDSKNIATAIFTIIKPTDHNPRKRRG
ncbi:MAG: hypothetical protein B7X12_00640 [Halothiobacillus sp. 20-53-49]|jgi:hypothetical protein|uniref:hypothetical protein n=1 Tax=Halothiobacillus sp. 15-55-196 TaxID=1970382 RepID=UPI000BCA8F5C|nr:hypothetical protein [Halothiobacillus sp. 15-55-196]OYV47430.1 MAG: hypothetical protein B7X12_00640 [Halothiobacillus sp. 20-53-49]OZB37288.1 MAG: hypothetical protein B7X44_02580 [Halothiobacillus sp. 15-55-196]HUM99187.1 hypothetical protein [Halothiobacillus sp.]